MNNYKSLTKIFLSEYAAQQRKKIHLSQSQMAEQLRITERAYGDLERGKYCFSATPLLHLMLILTDQARNELLADYRDKIAELENHQTI